MSKMMKRSFNETVEAIDSLIAPPSKLREAQSVRRELDEIESEEKALALLLARVQSESTRQRISDRLLYLTRQREAIVEAFLR